MTLLWLDFTFDVRGEIFTATYKINQRRWEILSSTRYLNPMVFSEPDIRNATEANAKKLIERL